MVGCWIRLGGVALVVALMTGCGAGREVDDVEAMLGQRYLEPLDAAGIHAVVEIACRYEGPAEAPWHLSVRLRLDAAQGRVAEVLVDQEVVVVRDRDPMIVQQVRDSPRDGWNGSLEASGGGAVLSLVYNNATRPGRFGALGWAEECPVEVS